MTKVSNVINSKQRRYKTHTKERKGVKINTKPNKLDGFKTREKTPVKQTKNKVNRMLPEINSDMHKNNKNTCFVFDFDVSFNFPYDFRK